MYACHAFALPKLSKVTNNPIEQANSSLLTIHEFGPLKLLLELWYYILGKFNERQTQNAARDKLITPPTKRSHAANL